MPNLPPPAAHQPLWQELLIASLRLPVRLALRLQRAQIDKLRDLLGIALFRELRAQGHSVRDMEAILDTSRWRIRQLAELAHTQDTSPVSTSLRRILTRLEAGPATWIELESLTPQGHDIDMTRRLLGMLTERGSVERYGEHPARYRLTGAHHELEARAWAHPITEAQRAYRVAVKILGHLDAGPLTLNELRALPVLRVEAADDVLRGAQMVVDHGGARWEGQGDEAQLVPTDKDIEFCMAEREERVRDGLIPFFHALTEAAEAVVFHNETDPLGQRIQLFKARKAPLNALIRRHHKETMALMAEENKASELKEKEGGDVRRALFFWVGGFMADHR